MGTSEAVIVTVNSLPVVSVTPSGPLSFCSGESVILTASSGAGYQWYKDGTAITDAVNATHAATVSGAYTVTVSNAAGCTNTSTATNIIVMAVSKPAIIQLSDTLISTVSGGNQWFLNNTSISGAVSQKHKVQNTGTYTVKVTDAKGCQSAFSAPVTVVITAPNVTMNSKEWIVFPNPVTNGKLVIRKNGTLIGGATAQVLSLDGRPLAEKKIGEHTEWNISGIAAGAYYLRITEQKGVSVYPFLKQ